MDLFNKIFSTILAAASVFLLIFFFQCTQLTRDNTLDPGSENYTDPSPGSVTGLSAVLIGTNTIRLNWNNPTGSAFDHVSVRHAPGSLAPASDLQGTELYNGTGTSFDFQYNTPDGSQHAFSVFSYNSDNEVDDSYAPVVLRCAERIVVTASKDTYISAANPGMSYGYDWNLQMTWSYTDTPINSRRLLIGFDKSTIAGINGSLLNVSLELTSRYTSGGLSDTGVYLYSLGDVAWGEWELSWSTAPTMTTWDKPGLLAGSTAIYTSLYDEIKGTEITADNVISLPVYPGSLGSWSSYANDPTIVVIETNDYVSYPGFSGWNNQVVTFYSDEATETTKRPRLIYHVNPN